METKEKQKKPKKVYRLVIFDEVSLKELLNINLTKRNSFTYGGALVIVIGFLVSLLFIFTPLKYFLPPVDNYQLENRIIKNSYLIDSLKKEIEFRDNYFEQVRKIINGEDIYKLSSTDSSIMNNLLTERQKDSILQEVIERDKQYLEQIRQNSANFADNVNFFKPVTGVVSNEFNPAHGHNGIDIVATENTSVLAVLPGTVTLATWSSTMGYIIQIQHSNNIISIYKHNGELLKKEGDKVNAGDPVALVGNTGEASTGPHLHFELWINGLPVNPKNYINF